MSWSSRLRHPVELSNGATLHSLADARDFIRSLPERTQLRPQWQSLSALLLRASNSANPALIALVSDRLREAFTVVSDVHAADKPMKKPAARSVRVREAMRRKLRRSS